MKQEILKNLVNIDTLKGRNLINKKSFISKSQRVAVLKYLNRSEILGINKNNRNTKK